MTQETAAQKGQVSDDQLAPRSADQTAPIFDDHRLDDHRLDDQHAPSPGRSGATLVDHPALPSRSHAATPAGDRIAIRGIEGFGRHGVFPSEREQGQRFVVDVVCAIDLHAAATTDDLDQTVDYGALAGAVRADIEGEPLNLIEALAGRIANTCLADAKIAAVEVTVHKPEAPMPVPVADTAVTLTRSKAE